MDRLSFLACLICLTAISNAEIKIDPVEYKDGDVVLKGYVAYDDAAKEKRPGVVVVHEWWGLNDYVKSRAEQLAGLEYVAFAADIFGDGVVTADAKVASQRAGDAKKAGLLRRRGELALEQLKKHDRVDPTKTAAMGYCFGGTTSLEMARAGLDLDGVVSFHGSLNTERSTQPGDIQGKVLVLHGAADPFVPPEQVEGFEKEMKNAKADYKIIPYEGAKHSFTNPDADKFGIDGVAYNKAADERSWTDMKTFFNEIFAAPAGAGPAQKRDYFVDGNVLRTGVYSIAGKINVTIGQAIAAAGGFDPPDLKNIQIELIRRHGADKEEIKKWKFDEMKKNGELEMALQANDVLRVRGD